MDKYNISGDEERKIQSEDRTIKSSSEDSPLRRALEQPPLKKFKVHKKVNGNFKLM